MSLPFRIEIREEGPREGFQFEQKEIPTERKLALIQALARTGLRRIQTVSFVDPRRVPGMADAELVCQGLPVVEGVAFGALWLNAKGFLRALVAPNLTIDGSVSVSASEVFGKRNQNRDREQDLAAAAALMALYAEHRVPFARATIMAAFGCNFQGEVPVSAVLDRIEAILALAGGAGLQRPVVSLADTMAWATPRRIASVVGAVRDKWPDLELSLHLHDTRGLAMVNAWEGMRLGVTRFDAAIAGLGGCPFAKHAGAAGNLCTEDLALLCAESGIETGLDLEALIEAGRLAEEVVGHPLPGRVKQGGRLTA
ncbi:hydroxymethylglutaryl-CoA lyase [Pseudoroseomonas cervicalis]|uniref:hydroxymethylglutaryl-CoA lyase n=1 Tax=Teichococcus cervicalis TaxID=204525 RepID=UPI002789B35A|nr:hydroxymethylglutaryl-CoA lyase [Pseudoroseomonas cervicalis]MDQ1078483.1 hydroxymethylglutaryl-CoA lyase [Pseudoroseomonas cervicalis]